MTKVSPPFVFTEASRQLIEKSYLNYPKERRQSAVMEILWIAQEQNGGWLSIPAIEAVAQVLDMPVIRVLELASFYSMYHTKPIGKHHVQVCQTLPCKLRGASRILETAERVLGIKSDQTTDDGAFTLSCVECLGCCANGPVVQINQENFEDLDADSFESILKAIQKGQKVEQGSQLGRQGSKSWKTEDIKKKKEKEKPNA